MGLFSNDDDKLKSWDVLSRNIARTKIPGGWLVQIAIAAGVGITFVPDPKHEWDGTSLDD